MNIDPAQFTECINNARFSLHESYLENGVTFAEAMKSVSVLSSLGLIGHHPLASETAAQIDIISEIIAEHLEEVMKRKLTSMYKDFIGDNDPRV